MGPSLARCTADSKHSTEHNLTRRAHPKNGQFRQDFSPQLRNSGETPAAHALVLVRRDVPPRRHTLRSIAKFTPKANTLQRTEFGSVQGLDVRKRVRLVDFRRRITFGHMPHQTLLVNCCNAHHISASAYRCIASRTSPTSSSMMSSRKTIPSIFPSFITRDRCAPECCIAVRASSTSSCARLTARLRYR